MDLSRRSLLSIGAASAGTVALGSVVGLPTAAAAVERSAGFLPGTLTSPYVYGSGAPPLSSLTRVVSTDDLARRCASGAGIWGFGDSVLPADARDLSVRLYTATSKLLAVDAAWSRPTASAVDAFSRWADLYGVPPVVLFATGTDDIYSPPGMTAAIDRVMAVAGTAEVVWVNTYAARTTVTAAVREADHRNSAWVNAQLAEATRRYPNLSIVRWFEWLAAKPSTRLRAGYALSDGVRTTLVGREARNTLIVAGVREALRKKNPTGTWGAPDLDEQFLAPLSAALWNVRDGWRDNQDQSVMRPANVSVQDGTLRLTARREQDGDRPYTSGYVDTRGKWSARYGRFEVKGTLPTLPGVSRGLWPALWLRDDTGGGEIDIMESIGTPNNHPEVYPSSPGRFSSSVYEQTGDRSVGKAYKSQIFSSVDVADGRPHTWAVEWWPDRLVFSVDGVTTWTVDGELFAGVMRGFPGKAHWRINLFMGSSWQGWPDERTVLPATFAIDHVRHTPLPGT